MADLNGAEPLAARWRFIAISRGVCPSLAGMHGSAPRRSSSATTDSATCGVLIQAASLRPVKVLTCPVLLTFKVMPHDMANRRLVICPASSPPITANFFMACPMLPTVLYMAHETD